MFAYCYNNPINYRDENGESPLLIVFVIIAAALAINHAVSLVESSVANFKVSDSYTEDEAKLAIEEITGKDTVNFAGTNVSIKGSNEIKSRYQRIYISTIIKNTVDSDGNPYTKRSVYSLSSEWYGHNLLSYHNIRSQQTDDVNLDKNFHDNTTKTKVGTVALMIVGGL